MQSTPSVDIKPDKPPKFDNDSAKWPEWSWKVRNHLATANIGAWVAVQFAEGRREEAIEVEEVEQLGWKILSDKLYSLLVSITTAESASIVMNTNPEGNGLEAWRRLAYRFNPPTTSSRVSDRQALMAVSPQEESKLGQAIEEWEARRTQYETKYKKALEDEDSWPS